MAISLTKGQKISLRKSTGSSLESFCVGVNWGAIEQIIRKEKSNWFGGNKRIVEEKKVTNVDLDLSCILFDGKGDLVDYIYSPEYRADFLKKVGLPEGKLVSKDYALRHSGDDRAGDVGGDDGLDNEIISVDLKKISPEVEQIFFFLNNVGNEDFAQIPFAKIRMYEGTPSRVSEVNATFDVVSDSQYAGHKAMIMGKLYKRNGEWKFNAIGVAATDQTFAQTIARISKDYV
ncbi:MAG: tellurium resistance TerZ family protein [Cytophagales bacterium]|nr:tellurium resistance TerZ family protein [Cytophagales bacterium]